MSIPMPLKNIFEAYCHVNATNIEMLAEHCKREDWSYSKPQVFKDQLREAIVSKSITIPEYDDVTKEEFDSIEELYDWLTEVWDQTIGEPLN